MRKRTAWILNSILLACLLLTAVGAICAAVELERESQNLHGAELLGSAVMAGFVLALSVFAVTVEWSVYGNLRYFLLCETKTPVKTGFHIAMLAAALLLVGDVIAELCITGILSDTCLVLFGVLLLLWLLYACVKGIKLSA